MRIFGRVRARTTKPRVDLGWQAGMSREQKRKLWRQGGKELFAVQWMIVENDVEMATAMGSDGMRIAVVVWLPHRSSKRDGRDAAVALGSEWNAHRSYYYVPSRARWTHPRRLFSPGICPFFALDGRHGRMCI